MSRRRWGLGLSCLALAGAVLVALLPPLAQPQSYHDFADNRAIFGLPNGLNVLTNLAFLWVAGQGLALLRQPLPGAFAEPTERWPYGVFFLGLAATGFGSAWYHLAPDHAGLFWDRLPMTVCFGALLTATLGDRFGCRWGTAALAPLVLAGVGTVGYWRYSYAYGGENVLPYFAFQAFCLLALPVLALGCPSRYNRGQDLAHAALLYGAAIAAEQADKAVFALGQILSGHSLKHLLAAAAISRLVGMLRERQARRVQ